MQFRSFCYLLVFTLFLFSCKKNKQASNLDSDVIIAMAEMLDSQGFDKRKLVLHCRTEQQYGCYNYNIGYQLAKQGNTLNIQFTHINMPNLCLTAIGPATATIDLGSLENGNYTLNIISPRGLIKATLVVSNEMYKLSLPPVVRGIQLEYDQLNRIPPYTIWGGVGYSNPNDAVLIQQFIDSLKLLGAMEIHLLPGNYREFVVDENGDASVNGSGYWLHKSILLHYGGSTEPIRNLVKYYGENYPDLYLSIYTDKGQYFYSWMK